MSNNEIDNNGFILPSSEPLPWADHTPQNHWDNAHDVARIEAQDKKVEALRTEAPKHLASQALRASSEGIINGSPFVDPRVANRYRQ